MANAFFLHVINITDNIQNHPEITLIALFELCRFDMCAKTFFQSDVPSYIWRDYLIRRKKERPVPDYPDVKQEHVIGRVYTIHPVNAELYYV